MNKINSLPPVSGRFIKEDGTAINVADLFNGRTITFHENISVPCNSKYYAPKGYKTLTFSCTGTNTSRSIEVYGVDCGGVNNLLPLSSVVDYSQMSSLDLKDLTVQCSVEGMSSIYIKFKSISGGNATVKGMFTR